MLRELLTHLLTPFPAPARRLGYLHEQIAIRARHRRHRQGWAPHLAACRGMIADAVGLCPRREVVAVVGAGVCLDVPVAELAASFRRVLLLDVGFLDRQAIARVERHAVDVTGCLQQWHDQPRLDDAAVLVTPPAWPIGLPAPDLTISANLCGQLHLLPAAWLERHRPRGADFRQRLGHALAAAHLAWLRARPGHSLLIADLAELAIDRGGVVVDEQPTVCAGLGLRAPDRTWDWALSPIPEWDPQHHLRHRVGAWLDP